MNAIYSISFRFEDRTAAIENIYSLPVSTFIYTVFHCVHNDLYCICFAMASGNAANNHVNPFKRQRQNSTFIMSSDLYKLNDQLDSISSDGHEFKRAIIIHILRK